MTKPTTATTTTPPMMILLIQGLVICALLTHPCWSAAAASSPTVAEDNDKAKTTVDDATGEASPVEETKQEKTCNLYMAPSSLVGHAGMGVYTVHDYQIGDFLLSGTDGPTIAVVDAHHAEADETSGSNNDPEWLGKVRHHWLESFGHYWWGRGVPDHVLFEGEGDVLDFQITFGSLPNHHCILDAIDYTFADGVYEDSLSNRYVDPGAGAYSYHRGRDFRASKNISAGSELFLNYGYCSRAPPESLHFPEWAGNIPMKEDYMHASRVVKSKWVQLVKEYETAEQVPMDIVISPPPEMHAMAAMLLPKTSGQILEIMNVAPQEAGFASRTELISQQLARTMASTPRTPEWVMENGLCIEHLVPGPSRIKQAGQGGIAQHAIKAGEIVVPAPLLHIADRDVLNIDYEPGPVRGQQLLLNYCLGHAESSLLLCPDTNAILINHCSHRTKDCGEDGPNAEYRWSSGWDTVDTDAFLNMTIEELAQHADRGLSMEVVALRNISPGDEVFVDYGIEWEEAWANHVKNWKPPRDEHVDPLLEEDPGLAYFSTKLANLDEHAPILPSFISGSLRDETDHPYIFTGCIYFPTEMDEDEIWEWADVDLDALSDEELIENFADDGSMFEGSYTMHHEGTYWPCHVLLEEEQQDDDKEDDDVDVDGAQLKYTVRISQRHYDDIEQQPWDKNELPRILYNYKRSSIHYFAKPYESDQHLFNTFRHFIGIQDDMFPPQWKNRKQPSSNEA